MTTKKKVVRKKKVNKGGRPAKSRSMAGVSVNKLKRLSLDESARVQNRRGPGQRCFDQVRLEAMSIFITDTSGCTFQELAKDPRIAKHNVSSATLRKWSSEDGWMDKRKEALDNFKQSLGIELQKTLTESLYREVKTLLEFHRQGVHHSVHTPPEKWEGVVKVTMEVQKRMAEIAEMMKSGILDGVGKPVQETGTSTRRMTHDFNPTDLREAAKSLTNKQRSAMRARIARTKRIQSGRNVGDHRQDDGGHEHPGGRVSGED